MTRRRISNRTPRELTAKERSALSDVVLELDSDFRVKAGSVADVSQVLPEAGVIVLNEYDGRIYYADNYGWHQQGADWSPITLFVEFNGVDQFDFKFKAPADSADPSTLIIHDGDGTITEVDGNDDITVTHTTDYSEAGTYYFYVLGDVLDLTYISINVMSMVTWNLGGISKLSNLETIIANSVGDGLTGNINKLTGLTAVIGLNYTNLNGDISALSNNTTITLLQLIGSASLYGDLSSLNQITSSSVRVAETSVTFDNVITWAFGGSSFWAYDCNWTTTMVDNCLISLANGGTTGATIKIGGNNAARTSVSDAALATLEGAGCTVTVNE